MNKMVPAWRTGCLGTDDYGKYVCTDCGLIMHTKPRGKGYCITAEEFSKHFECPACASKEKKPTVAPDIEELEKRKAEIRERMK